ncbi:MAG: RagB/SusD family nutrient uptake outer membrane protein [Bacteroidota bacterium]
MKLNQSLIIIIGFTGLLFSSCMKDLDVKPKDSTIISSATVFDDPASYKQFLAKLYATLSLTGQRGEAGLPEIQANDEGTTSFLREFWTNQESSTDENLNAWGDQTEHHSHSWSDQNPYVKLMYQRLYINISYCNELIRSANENMSKLDPAMQTEVTRYVAEARFLRAFFYQCSMDLYGNVPFVTETDRPGAFLPKRIVRAELFKYVENELKEILPALADPGMNEYARVDRAAAWALLSRLYLNAQVYTGTQRNAECIIYANEVINSGKFKLHSSYPQLFLSDNEKYRQEIILPIASDANNSRGYGDVTFLIHAAVGGSEDATNGFGIASGGWAGNRIVPSFVNTKFADPSGATDHRALFYSNNQTLTITHTNVFTEGYLCAKFKNISSTGALGRNATFVDTDFPLIRLAEVYLNYAEATVRGGAGGDAAKALSLVNELRTRAYGNTSGNINAGQLNLNFLIDERGRELYWEGHRRTDLIRFGMFTGGTYLWDWKGNVMNGKATDAHYNLYPIPASDLLLNTNLIQNPGY